MLVDEWQLEPDVWDRVRRAVDDDSTGGRFLLAGSAGVAPGVRIHSGAGRIVSMAMRPMFFSERGVHEPTVSLLALLDVESAEITGTSDIDLRAYTDEILRSGFPGIRDLPERARQLQLDSYIARTGQRELPENGVNIRRPAALRAWLSAYAAATATNAAYSTILDAATPGEGDKPARQTVDVYREHLQRLFALSVRVYATSAAATVGHLRTRNNLHEVDLVVEAANRSCVAIEVKLADTVNDHDVQHLNWLREQIGDRLVNRIVVYTGRFAYRRPDGVAVVPLALLGP